MRICLILLFLVRSVVAFETESVVIEGDTTNEASTVATHPQRIVGNKKNAKTFIELVDDERGVDAQEICATCGAKRLRINGLHGEHTTILVDGLLLHSALSSFYGLDAISAFGSQYVDVMRGSGAALGYPESLAGAINIVSKRPFVNSANVLVSGGGAGVGNHAFDLSWKKNMHSFYFGGSYATQGHWDRDDNGVAESGNLTSKGVRAKYVYKLNDSNTLEFRGSSHQLSIIGGTTTGFDPSTYPDTQAEEDDFEDTDVRKDFLGDESEITEKINVTRHEVVLRFVHTGDYSWEVASGLAYFDQDSIYMHGYDYGATDYLNANRFALSHYYEGGHLVTWGIDNKNQSMNSRSVELFDNQHMNKDSFRTYSLGTFLQDEWIISDRFELASTLRLDKIYVKWKEYNTKIDRYVVAPRFNFKWNHGKRTYSLFSFGVGYRAPLTLYETQHGASHGGFDIAIDREEKGYTLAYTFDYSGEHFYFNTGPTFTRIKHMAWGEDRIEQSLPILFQNYDGNLDVFLLDALLGVRLGKKTKIDLTLESFIYPDEYKRLLPVAAIEKRAKLTFESEIKKIKFKTDFNVVGARDLSKYGHYNQHYNLAHIDTNMMSPTYGEVTMGDQKKQRAPLFVTIDLMISYPFKYDLEAFIQVKNLTDYTQTDNESPATWHLHGDHFHFDNFHLWGPLRGREFLAGLKGSW